MAALLRLLFGVGVAGAGLGFLVRALNSWVGVLLGLGAGFLLLRHVEVV